MFEAGARPSVEEALALIEKEVAPLGAETVPLDAALGRLTAASVHALIDMPGERSTCPMARRRWCQCSRIVLNKRQSVKSLSHSEIIQVARLRLLNNAPRLVQILHGKHGRGQITVFRPNVGPPAQVFSMGLRCVLVLSFEKI